MANSTSHAAPDAAWQAPGLLGAALLLWGAMVDMLGFALPLAILVELPRLTSWRWQLDRRDFDRVCDLTGILLLMLALYQFDRSGVRGIYGMLAWAPLAFAPLLLSQAFSTSDQVSLASLLYSVRLADRRGQFSEPGSAPGAVDVRPAYFILCLLSAATLGATRDGGGVELRALYLPGCALLMVLALFANRPRRAASPLAWLLVVLLAVTAAWAGAQGVVKVRRALEPMVMAFMADYVRRWRDPFSGHVSLGDLGALKGSERIVARVRPPLGLPPPRRLREASYQSFSRSLWMSRSRRFSEVPAEGDGERWTLHEPAERTDTARIAMAMRGGRGLLPVPPGTEQLSNLPVEQVFRTELDVLKVERGPGVVEFDARYSRGNGNGARARADDLVVPAHLADTVARYGAALGLDTARRDDSAATLVQWFAHNFEYSLDGFRNARQVRGTGSPIELFLDEARRGHCELFATATVLLLRGAGIPARYSVGFAVDEWSELEQAYVVRRRHAHAWAEMWDGTHWRAVDTTPATWFEADAAGSNWWDKPRDWLSYSWFSFMRWRWLTDRGTWFDSLPWLVPPLLGLLAWRLARRKRRRNARHATAALQAGPPEFGADSEFFSVISALEQHSGIPRRAFETLTGWFKRLRAGPLEAQQLGEAQQLLGHHERLRFDPRGLDDSERRMLETGCARWLARFGARSAH